MRRNAILMSMLAAALLAAACAKAPAAAPTPAPLAGDDQKTLYALGAAYGRNLVTLELTPEELGLVQRGLADSAGQKTLEVDLQQYGPRIQGFVQARVALTARAEKEKAKPFLEAAAKEPGAVALPSGVIVRTLTPGKGPSPKADDAVTVHYVGTLVDGTPFDSSEQHGGPARFKLNQVVRCWGEAIQRMKVAERARLVCPSDTAYGDAGRPPTIKGGATLIFEVELLDIVKEASNAPKSEGNAQR